MSRCVIIPAFIEGKIRELVELEEGDFILCADRGFELALKEDITPDLIVGDFDSAGLTEGSITTPVKSKAELPEGIETRFLPVHKDITDTAAALEIAVENGYDEIVIAGGIGGRLDHTIANIANIVATARKGISVKMVSQDNIVTAVADGSTVIKKIPGYKFSLFSYTDRSEGITVRGAEYNLEDAVLTSDFPLGVSNEFFADEVFVEVKKGTLLIVLSHES